MNNLVAETEPEITEGYRLSPQQRHLWFLQQAETTAKYLAKCAISISGKFDLQILKSALNKIGDRYEIFRTNFDSLPGMTVGVQIIRDVNISWGKEHDLTQVYSNQKMAEFEKIWSSFSQKIFDLKQGSLFHVSLVKMSSEEQILLINLPTLNADSKSLQILVNELSQEYAACLEGNELPEAELQYADIAEWQNELLEAEEAKLGKEYWQKQDISHRFNLEIPFAKQSEEFQPQVEKITIDGNLADNIESITKQLDVSTSDFLLTCWLTLISRLTKESNILLGIVGNGRRYEELETALGLFAKHLPLSCQVEEDLKFYQLLERVKLSVSEVLKWQEYFTWEQFVASTENYSEECFLPLSFEFIELNNISGNTNFSLDRIYTCIDKYQVKLVVTKSDKLTAEFHYDANAYHLEDIQRLGEQFQTLLTGAVENTAAEISQLKINNDRHLQQLQVEFNNTQKTYPVNQCIHKIFEEQAKLNPDNIAIVFEDQKISYAELNAKSNQLAHYLQRQGIKPDVPVAIYSDRSLEIIIAILAILKAGGAYLPLDSKLPLENLSFRLQDANAPVVLTKQYLVKNLSNNEIEKICLDSDWDKISQESTENPSSEVTPENLIYIIYTSGSTGKPKGVAVEHQQLFNYIYSIQDRLEFTIATYAIISTFAADLGNTVVFPALCSGGCLHIISEERVFDAEALTDYFSNHPIDCMKIVPSHLGALLSSSDPEKILPRQRLILGGEALSWQLLERIQKLAPDLQIFNHYGPSETTVGVTTLKLQNMELPSATGREYNSYAKTVPLGRPIANTYIHILDKHQEPVPIGVAGELHIGGAGLSRGYLNRPELTAEKFIIWKESGGRDVACNVRTESEYVKEERSQKSEGKRLYKTGDLARYLPDGNIEFLGRIDNQIKIHGFRVELGEIETAINQHPAVTETVVILRKDEPERQRLVAYIVLNQELESVSEKLRDFLTAKLPEPTIPSTFVPLKSLPLTANGKIDRQALPTPETILSQNTFIAPTSTVEKQLAEIWAEVLRIEKVSINDNFFGLGGDSILGIQVIAKANQVGLNITPKQLFAYQTIAKLSTVIDALPAFIAEQGIVTGEVPLTPIQHWFFEQNLPEAHHWNQSVLLEVSPEINLTLLEETLSHLLQHHDGLRLRFVQDKEKWQQFLEEPKEQIPFVRIAVTDDSEFEDLATQIQASLNLSQELIKVALFEFPGNQSNRLLLAIHHLVVDGISWRVLLEDFQTVYQQLSQGSEIKLPGKTTSFKKWSEKLGDYAKSEELKSELNYWIKELSQPVTYLQKDYPEGDNTVALSKTVSVALTVEETQALLQEVPAVYQTQINDVLLTALVLAWQQQTRNPSLLLDLESHGREDIFSDVNLSRTTGWFTSIFPVGLNLHADVEVGDALKIVKEKLRAIPNGGIGYGLLRYLSDEETVNQLQDLPKSDIRFNYLGQFDGNLQPSSLFKPASESRGIGRSLKGTRSYLLDINGLVSGGKLQLNWTYSSAIHHQNTIKNLAECYVEKLREIIQHCQSIEVSDYIPSDVSNAIPDDQEINFNAEAILDPTIVPATIVGKNIINPNNILLTGATGFIGTYLLNELLQKTSANIYCLVRATDTNSAKQKLQSKLESYFLWDEAFSSRIIPLVGDLSAKSLGLSIEQFNYLANQIDVIYHNGALVNHIYPYSVLKPANVLGTQEILRLASKIHVKPVHFMSTLSVLSLPNNSESTIIFESDTLSEFPWNEKGYTHSKWVAEKLIMAAQDRGIPTCIYRLGMITGDTNTGVSNINDRICRMIQGCIQLGMVPTLEDEKIGWVPVNEAIQAIVHLSQQEKSLGKAFHLTHPEPGSYNNLFDCICSLDSSVKKVSLNDWIKKLSTSPENSYYAFYLLNLELNNQKSPEEKSDKKSITIDNSNTKNGLAGSNIMFTSINKKYIQTMLQYLQQSSS
ncbi:amino acid adenylation domain-containing protein [Dapis sp. BLCC M126]|uniref:amino acid adenylation domain-containing protein n=1 Tax=Dapis sp. BLCC M126 TaxID=3400189 RepID=UPI003CEF5E43